MVERVDGSDVYLHQDLRDTRIDWFYWCFRVRGAAGKKLRFVFTKSQALGVRGPAVSLDQGRTWSWLGSEVVDANSFTYALPENASDVRFSFGMPYLESDWHRFMATLKDRSSIKEESLCTSGKGREVECLTLASRDGNPKHRVAITCRHHCCEMMPNYTLEGLIHWLLSDPKAKWLREHVEFMIIPFVDKDGVEDGDQGKGRQPRDHGRDYLGESIYASTRAIREKLPVGGDNRLHLGLDLHCPWIRGKHNEDIYLVGSEDPRVEAEEIRFSEILEESIEGPLPFSRAHFLPFGQGWNTGANYADGKGFKRWVQEIPGVVLGATMEIPYANTGGSEVNQQSARAFGVDLGKAVSTYLQGLKLP